MVSESHRIQTAFPTDGRAWGGFEAEDGLRGRSRKSRYAKQREVERRERERAYADPSFAAFLERKGVIKTAQSAVLSPALLLWRDKQVAATPLPSRDSVAQTNIPRLLSSMSGPVTDKAPPLKDGSIRPTATNQEDSERSAGKQSWQPSGRITVTRRTSS